MTSRRHFILQTIPAAAIVLTGSRAAFAQAGHIEETDPTAVALGYKHDATKVDAKKYPAYVAGRVCNGCQLYQGKVTDAWAPCGAMGGKQVNGKGWCVAWAKKAA
ncbi:hypothetical protein RCH09_001855 [Actimicrobium sp. GrIS 1.19]|uniref:high-potential iron-sulfur protein n=1 Tax=Actimicrobium sp. GrIS 1.19 TaxID=3071708 RepID=UPI002E0125FE|nr:hypothetical protein [Actimicrobium sp. GrIS 1.19]